MMSQGIRQHSVSVKAIGCNQTRDRPMMSPNQLIHPLGFRWTRSFVMHRQVNIIPPLMPELASRSRHETLEVPGCRQQHHSCHRTQLVKHANSRAPSPGLHIRISASASGAAQSGGFDESTSHPLPVEQAQPAAESAGDSVDEHSTPAFKRTRLLTFAVMWIGYASFYITRTSLNYVTPTMMKDASLGIHYTEIGALTSIMPIAYGASKFLSGVLGSQTSPRILLAGGLAAAALVNAAFGCGSALWWFVFFWGLNGLLQGLGAPACARTITAWFSGKERGTYWGFWTASNNVGGFLAPLVAGTAARHYGWRAGMWAPGAVGVAVAAFILLFMKDSPEAAGFHPIEQAQGKKGGSTTEKRSMKEILVDECLKNPQTLLFAMSYFCVYIVRTGVTAWFIHYLIKAKGLDTAAAAVRVSGLELGGLAGSLSAGALSDLLVRKFPDAPAVGLRVRVVVGYAAATAAALAAFAASPNQSTLQWLAVAAVGFALYGPQMLVGLCGAEVVSPSAVGASQGFLGSISYIGSSMAGLPLSLILQHYGWGALFTSLIGACGLTVALLLPLLNAQSYTQRAARTA